MHDIGMAEGESTQPESTSYVDSALSQKMVIVVHLQEVA